MCSILVSLWLGENKNGRDKIFKTRSYPNPWSATFDATRIFLGIIKNNPTHKFYKEIENVTFSNGKLSITDEKNCVQLVNAISDALVTAYISEVETVEEGRR